MPEYKYIFLVSLIRATSFVVKDILCVEISLYLLVTGEKRLAAVAVHMPD